MATHSSALAWRITGMGAWWAAVYRVAESWTRLTCLSSSSSLTVSAKGVAQTEKRDVKSNGKHVRINLTGKCKYIIVFTIF